MRSVTNCNYSAEGLFYDGTKIRGSWVLYRILKIRNGELLIHGYHLFNNLVDYECYIRDDKGEKYPLQGLSNTEKPVADQPNLIVTETYFDIKIRLGDIKYLEFVAENKSNQNDIIVVDTGYGKFAKLTHNITRSFYTREGYILQRKGSKLIISRGGFSAQLKKELSYDKYLFSVKKKHRLALYRLLAFLYKSITGEKIWLISDRDNKAGDNGEALFKYLVKHEKDVKLFFVISKDSPDYNRMKQYGKVLALDSFRYKVNFLAADKVISAHADDWVINAFGNDSSYVRGMYDFDFVFLQHGVIMNDLSAWLRRYNKDISLFITSVPGEYRSILDYGYGYSDEVVKMTGLPRYDYLENKAEKKIVFLPTWRKGIAGDIEAGTSHRQYSKTFKDSEYCRYYNALINDERMIKVLADNGYTAEMYIHPALAAQSGDFTGNKTIKVVNETADYRKVFRENALLITDYSSVAIDFSYMKKPVIYTQFDRANFFDNQFYDQGYFDYERDGAGPVCYDMDSTVETIIGYVENGCVMQDIYKKRVEDFFTYTDRNNCERVYREIKRLDSPL